MVLNLLANDSEVKCLIFLKKFMFGFNDSCARISIPSRSAKHPNKFRQPQHGQVQHINRLTHIQMGFPITMGTPFPGHSHTLIVSPGSFPLHCDNPTMYQLRRVSFAPSPKKQHYGLGGGSDRRRIQNERGVSPSTAATAGTCTSTPSAGSRRRPPAAGRSASSTARARAGRRPDAPSARVFPKHGMELKCWIQVGTTWFMSYFFGCVICFC